MQRNLFSSKHTLWSPATPLCSFVLAPAIALNGIYPYFTHIYGKTRQARYRALHFADCIEGFVVGAEDVAGLTAIADDEHLCFRDQTE